MNFDDAAQEELLNRGRPFIVDLVLKSLEGHPDQAKLRAALENPKEYPGRKLSRIIGKMGFECSYGAIENWRDRYTPGWRRSEGGY